MNTLRHLQLPRFPGYHLRASACTQTGSDVWLLSAHAHQLDVNYKPLLYVNAVAAVRGHMTCADVDLLELIVVDVTDQSCTAV